MAAFNFDAMLRSLGGQQQDQYGGLGQLVQMLAGGNNIPSGNPLSPVQQPVQPSSAPAPVIAPDAPAPAPATTDPNIINVNGKQAEAPNYGNRDTLEEAANAAKQAPQRSGMFGTKGTLRDILGVLGDAFLVQSGNKAVYAPARQLEKQSDQLAGFTQDPMAAIERLAAGGNGAMATDLSKDYNTNQVQRMTAGKAAQQAADANYQKYGSLFGQYIGAATPETYERIKPILQTLKARGQLGDEFSIPDTYDQAMNKTYQMGGMNSTNQIRTDQTERKMEETGRHNKATETNARISATRPRAGRAEPQPTAMSQAAPILAKVQRGEKLTPGETEVLNRTAPIRGKGSRPIPPLPPGFSVK